MTTVTAAVGTRPPGTLISLLYAAQVAIQRSPTVKPKLRSGSSTFLCGSHSSAE